MKLKHIYIVFLAFILNKVTAQTTASKQVTKFTITAPQLDTIKTIWVYLPKHYENSDKTYPVIYMHDAQNLFDNQTSYSGEWNIDEYLDSHPNSQSIIVGIEHGNNKRISELTPYKNDKYGGGNGNAYLAIIKHTLKPHKDLTYKTKPETEHTTIFGSSLGGLISFYAVLKYPETFGKAGVFSPGFWINPDIFDFVKTTEIPETSKFYFLAGTNEGETMIPNLEKMLKLLESKGIKTHQLKNQIIEGGQHNETFWAAHFGQAYEWLNK